MKIKQSDLGTLVTTAASKIATMAGTTQVVVARAAARLHCATGNGDPATIIDSEVLLLLGCPAIDHTRNLILTPGEIVEDRPRFGYYYPLLLGAAVEGNGGWSENITPLLAGVSRYDLLADFLRTESSTYDLAVALLIYLDAARTSRLSKVLHFDTAPAACAIMNAWLKPYVPLTVVPTADALATALFGPAWSMVGPAAELLAGGETIRSYVYNLVAVTRPPFLPGLCPAQDAQTHSQLPAMDSLS